MMAKSVHQLNFVQNSFSRLLEGEGDWGAEIYVSHSLANLWGSNSVILFI